MVTADKTNRGRKIRMGILFYKFFLIILLYQLQQSSSRKDVGKPLLGLILSTQALLRFKVLYHFVVFVLFSIFSLDQ